MIDGDMETLKMKSIFLTDEEKEKLESFEAVSYIEEDGWSVSRKTQVKRTMMQNNECKVNVCLSFTQ